VRYATSFKKNQKNVADHYSGILEPPSRNDGSMLATGPGPELEEMGLLLLLNLD
jgi:hypothetical protein